MRSIPMPQPLTGGRPFGVNLYLSVRQEANTELPALLDRLQNDEFVLEYQPQIDAETGRLEAVEARAARAR